MFAYPTRKQLIERSNRRPAPIGRTGVLKTDIVKSSNELKKRVAQKNKMKQECTTEKDALLAGFLRDTDELKNAHSAALKGLREDCDDAKVQLRNAGNERLNALKLLKDRQIKQENAAHKETESALKMELGNTDKIVANLENNLEELEKLKNTELKASKESESAMKTKLGKKEKEIRELNRQIKEATDIQIGMTRQIDQVDKELKDSFKYLLQVSEKEINDKLLFIQKLAKSQQDEIDKLLDSNDKLEMDIENKANMKIVDEANLLNSRIEEQKRLGNAQSKVIIKKMREDCAKKMSEIEKQCEEKIKMVKKQYSKQILEIIAKGEEEINRLANEISAKQDKIDEMQRQHSIEIANNKKAHAKELKEKASIIAELQLTKNKSIMEKASIIIQLNRDNKGLRDSIQRAKSELHQEKENTLKLEKQIADINEAHRKKLENIHRGEKAVTSELKKMEQQKQIYITNLERDCSAKAKELTDVLSKKTELERKITKLTCEVEQSRRAVGLDAPDNAHCKVIHSDLVNTLSGIVENKTALEREVGELKQSKSQLSSEKGTSDKLSRKNKSLEEQIASLNARLRKSQEKVGTKLSQITQLMAKSEKNNTLIASLKEKLSKMSDTEKELRTSDKDSRARVGQLDSQLRGAMSDKTKLERQITKLSCEVEQSRRAVGLDAPDNSHCKVMHSDLVNKLGYIVGNSEALSKEVSDLKQSKSQLSSGTSEFEKLARTNKSLEGQIASLNARLKKSQERVGTKTSQISQLAAKSEKNDRSIASLKESLVRITNSEKELRTSDKDSRARAGQLDSQLRGAMSDKTHLERQISKLSCEINQTKRLIGMDAEDLKHCKVMHSDLQRNLGSILESRTVSNRKNISLERLNEELTKKNQDLERLIPQTQRLEKELEAMKRASDAKALDAKALKRATAQARDVPELVSSSISEQMKILEKAIYVPWSLAGCYGKSTPKERELCQKYEGIGKSFRLSDAQKGNIRRSNLERYSGFSARLSNSVNSPLLKRKLMIIENTGYVPKQFKNECIKSNGQINTGKASCRLPNRNYRSNVNQSSGLSRLQIRPDFRF